MRGFCFIHYNTWQQCEFAVKVEYSSKNGKTGANINNTDKPICKNCQKREESNNLIFFRRVNCEIC